MSLIDTKRSVVNSIGAYNSMLQDPELPDITDSLPSINNNDDPVGFLLDIIKVIAGADKIVRTTGELFTNFVDETEPVLKDGLINQSIQEDSNLRIPSFFRPSGSGVRVPVQDVDLFGKLKTNPSSDMGSLLYDVDSDTFDKAAYEAISTGNETVYNNLSIQYNDVDDTFTLKATDGNAIMGDWVTEFVEENELINKNELMVEVLDSIFGTVTSKLDKSEEQIFEELKILQILENGIEGAGLGVSDEDITNLRQRADEVNEGIVNLDLGCGVFAAELTIERLNDFLDVVNGSTDPNLIGNELNKLVDDTVDDEEVLEENEEAIEDGFFKRLIQKIKTIILKAILATPYARVLQSIISAFKNGGLPKISVNFEEDIENFKILINCILTELRRELNRYLYVLAIGLLVALLKLVIKKITKERINNWIRVIKSLLI